MGPIGSGYVWGVAERKPFNPFAFAVQARRKVSEKDRV